MFATSLSKYCSIHTKYILLFVHLTIPRISQKWEATIEDAYRKTTRIDDRVAVLEILDTAGQEDFSAMRAQWMTDKDGYVFVYSLDDEDSLQQLYGYLETLEQVNSDKPHAPPIVVVGNKKDLVVNISLHTRSANC